MHLKLSFVVLLFAAAAACRATGAVAAADNVADSKVAVAAQTEARNETAREQADSAAGKREEKQKELRSKRRELANTKLEHGVAALDRHIAEISAQEAINTSKRGLEAAQAALDLFMTKQKPRELEQHKIRIDRRIYAADHAKDELTELTAMYEADEFAKTTKELVLKRGRRSLEMAERELAVAKNEFEEFENFTLKRRLRDLSQKLLDAQFALTKAELAAQKPAMSKKLALKKEAEKLSDLEEEIAALQAALAKAKS